MSVRLFVVCLCSIAVAAGASSCGSKNDSVRPNGPTSINVVNGDFELIYKAGSTTATAPALVGAQNVSGTLQTGMTGPTVTFSDNSIGNVFDLPGWSFTSLMGVTNEATKFSTAHGNVFWMNGATFGGGSLEKVISQVLTETVQQGSTYTLTANFGWRNDNAGVTGPQVLRLYAGSTLLTPTSSVTPDLVKGDFVTLSRTYVVNDPALTGALRIEVGLGPNTNGQQLNIDHVMLTRQ